MFVKSLALIFFLFKLGCGDSIPGEHTTSVSDFSGQNITSEYLEKNAELFVVDDVDLSNNDITTIKSDIFDKVKTLNLTGNKNLKMPEDSEFIYSSNLETLILADCGLEMIPALAFTELPNLKRLDISENDIDLSNFKDVIMNLQNAEIEVILSNITEDMLAEICNDYNMTFEIKSLNEKVSCNQKRSEKMVAKMDEKPSQAEYLQRNNEHSEEMAKDNSTHAETNDEIDGNIDMATDSSTTDEPVTDTTIMETSTIEDGTEQTEEVTDETTLAVTTESSTETETNGIVLQRQPVSQIEVETQIPPKHEEDFKIMPKDGRMMDKKPAQSDEDQKDLNDTSSEAKEDPTKESNASSTIIYVIIGVGVVVFAVFGYLYYKKKHSYSTVTTEENEGKELQEIRTIKHEETNGDWPKPSVSESKPLMYGEQKEETKAPNMYGDKKPESFEEEAKPVRFPPDQEALTYSGSVLGLIDDDVRKSMMVENTEKSQSENEVQEDSSK